PLDALTVVCRVLAVARARHWRARWREKVQEIRGNEPILWKNVAQALILYWCGYLSVAIFVL
ncbi:MAG: hypothetical protein OXE94_04045, partial [Aestuariivita sp.]|nr:hypothetical protein [Aestuariivita sp.]